MPVEQQFLELVRDHQSRTGFHVPGLLEQYLVELLSSRLERVEVIPQPSFAERYLELYHYPRIADLKDYADQCLFFCSLMPEYGRRRGLDLDYYASLGISTYYTAGDLADDPRYTQLGNWFYHLQRFLNSALHPDQRLEFVKFT
jgi:hypothetical protein